MDRTVCRLRSLNQNQIRLLWESLLDDSCHLIDSEANVALVILCDTVRLNSTQSDRISVNATYIVMHGSRFSAPNHVDFPSRISELLPKPFSVSVAIGGFVALGDGCAEG